MTKKLRITVFLLLGTMLFGIFTNVLSKKWNYIDSVDNIGMSLRKYENFYGNIDVFFVGASNLQYAISPMYLYEHNGIVSYNLSSGGMSIECTKFLVADIFSKGYMPKVIVIDPNILFDEVKSESSFRRIMDNLPLNREKLKYINNYLEATRNRDLSSDRIREILAWVSPLYRYHERWNELEAADFYSSKDDDYFMYGYYSYANIASSNNDRATVEYIDDMLATLGESKSYSSLIIKNNAEIIEDLNDICIKNDCKLLLLKTPMQITALEHPSSWSKLRHEAARNFAKQYNITFIDLNYDVDIGIDWAHDTCDHGIHMNLNGAQKVTEYIGDYLSKNYEMLNYPNPDYDKHKELYDKYMAASHIATAYELKDYLEYIKKSNLNIVVIMSVANGMRNGLSDKDMETLAEFGLKSDFKNMGDSSSFIAISDGNKVLYEQISDSSQTKYMTIEDDSYYIESSGYLDGNRSSIVINQNDLSLNQRGINFVIYEKDSGMVIDKAYCDTYVNEHDVVHESAWEIFEYQQYLLGRK